MRCTGGRVSKLSIRTLIVLIFLLAYNSYAEESKSSWQVVKTLKVRGLTISKGLHADSVFKVLTKSDGVSESDVKKDGIGSLIITHHWKVDNQFIDITFRRWDNMYRVHSMRVREVKTDRTEKKKATSPKRDSPTKSEMRAASHKAVQANCRCTIIEWDGDTFDYMQAEGNNWEAMENFTSKGSEGIAKSLCFYVKLLFNPSTGKLTVVEVDYYSPDTCD